MELVNINDSFDPTPKLKSSPVPILFVSFNRNDNNCICCGEVYIKSLYCDQKYCKKCLSSYLTKITNKNIYLDVYCTKNSIRCIIKHESNWIEKSQNIQKCCRNCLKILCFKILPIS